MTWIAGAGLTVAAVAAEPQGVLARAPQPEQPARFDLGLAGPGIADTLSRELAPSVLMHGQEGTVQVQFRPRGNRVREVVSRGGPREYRQPIRSALRGVSCLPGRDGERFEFAIRCELDREPAAPQRLVTRVVP